MAVLTDKEWLRLKKKAVIGRTNEPIRKTDRNELHETSKRIVKNWDNTIEVKLQCIIYNACIH